MPNTPKNSSKLGALGGFASMMPAEFGGSGRGLSHAIQVIDEVSKECVSTGFLVWAQYALQWYLVNSTNPALCRSGAAANRHRRNAGRYRANRIR